jgi:hypothetical protein
MKPTQLPQSLPVVRRGQTLLLVAPQSFLRQALPTWIARQAMKGPLHVLDGGGRFNPYTLARPLRRLTPQAAEVMRRVYIQRAFTCYQMAALLEEVCARDATPPNNGGACVAPLVVLDLLHTFQDEDVAAHERRRLLAGGLGGLKRLCQAAPVVVTASSHIADSSSNIWLEILEAGLENPLTWWFEEEPLPPPALMLF